MCCRKVAGGRRVASVIRSLVNVCSMNILGSGDIPGACSYLFWSSNDTEVERKA